MFDDQNFDSRISSFTESIARKLDRRKLFANGVRGLFATAAGVTLGQLVNIQQAFADTCTCHWAFGGQCSGCPYDASCPSGYSVCTTTQNCNGWCNYSGGQWVSCSNQGRCGVGFRMCTDCLRGSCSFVCTCLSGCICCTSPCCQTKEDVRAEMQRLAAMPVQA